MPSYVAPKPSPNRTYHHGPRPVTLDWTVRTTNAIAALQHVIPFDDRAREHINKAMGHLALLRTARTNRAHQRAHQLAARELAIAFYLLEPKG